MITELTALSYLITFVSVIVLSFSASSGILLKAEEGFFEIGEMYFLRVKTNMGTLKMQCEIVRIQNNGAGLEEYGCRIGEVMLFPNEEAAVKPSGDAKNIFLTMLSDMLYDTRIPFYKQSGRILFIPCRTLPFHILK